MPPLRRPLHLAYFSPLPPVRSGIADYSRELLPHLARQVEITLFTADPAQVDNDLRREFAVQPIANYAAERWHFDIALYQMGNSIHHEPMYQVFTRYPGLLVLHDYFIHHFIVHRTAGQANYPGYARELGYALGAKGIKLAWEIRQGSQSHPVMDLPLNGRLLDLSLGTIVHSRYVQRQIQQERSHHPVQVIPALIEAHPGTSRRAELGWSDDTLVFASVGQVTAAKQLALALRAFRQLRQAVPNSAYLIVGESLPEVNLPHLVEELGLVDSVVCIDYVDSLPVFVDWIHTADVIINLRYPTLGETSATALRALAAGRPLIVFDHGWYSEIPDDACIKTQPLDEGALLAAMMELAHSPERRSQLGEAARRYINNHCRPSRVAAAYLAFIEQQLQRIRARYA